ncbi:hypothetical protein AYR62_10985 [Secundilactobacillus paracollinoides]|uniref:Uncharacterized protein n=1 Tax=Secundilactobacillus paracollinoides TaxID=240427 RepID=A0A1B2IY32_9LACO|nr:hypothetical protein [Secundilactobacillus paracollinoides]ANZ64558.1 hypothetical protein AYR62_10985 [Secundilactobacillus paracollinoides]ANZ66941.1 hypothetical protein AYR63_07220 [Secundilactobacillus paracollinoides]KRL76994.1 hypothetical protein FC17_GL001450 [Secundilactobacillus paracollinoides DSM 15502 = JCM 11969]
MMTQPELASDEIISRLHLPTLRNLLNDLSLDYDQLESNVASQADLHKKGNNPPSYTNVRSLGEVIEDAYDGYVQTLYQDGTTDSDETKVVTAFRQQLNQDLNQFVLVKNTGRAYLADETAGKLSV